MFVILTHTSDGFDRFAEALVPGLRTYWGQRGIAVHHMDFQQTAKEAAIAANYHLTVVDSGLVGYKKELVGAIWSIRPVSEWTRSFVLRARREVDAWTKSDLNYIVLVTNMHEKDYIASGSLFGRHMVYKVGAQTHAAGLIEDPIEEWAQKAQKDITDEYSSRTKEGFLG